jgi:hypothetical protein
LWNKRHATVNEVCEFFVALDKLLFIGVSMCRMYEGKGVENDSGISREEQQRRAQLALDVFCYRIKKYIGNKTPPILLTSN